MFVVVAEPVEVPFTDEPGRDERGGIDIVETCDVRHRDRRSGSDGTVDRVDATTDEIGERPGAIEAKPGSPVASLARDARTWRNPALVSTMLNGPSDSSASIFHRITRTGPGVRGRPSSERPSSLHGTFDSQ